MDIEFRDQQTLNKIAWHALPVDVIVSLYITDLTTGLSDKDVAMRRAILSAGITPLASTRMRSSEAHRTAFALFTATITFWKWLDHSRRALLKALNVSRDSILKRPTKNARTIISTLTQREARALRNSISTRLPAVELVPGDIILVEAGDIAPADGRLFFAQSLSCLEPSLNGSTTPAQKSTAAVAINTSLKFRSDMIYRGTKIATGSGRAIVVATGLDTEVSR